MPYWRKFTLYVIIAVSVTFGIAYLLGSLGRVIILSSPSPQVMLE